MSPYTFSSLLFFCFFGKPRNKFPKFISLKKPFYPFGFDCALIFTGSYEYSYIVVVVRSSSLG